MKTIFKLSLIEIRKIYKRIFILFLALTSIFVSFNVLSTVATSIKNSLYSSYGECSFTMEEINIDFLMKVNDNFSTSIHIDNIQGVSEYYNNENTKKPFFEFQNNKSDVCYFIIKNNDIDEINTYEDVFNKEDNELIDFADPNIYNISGCFNNNDLEYDSIILSDVIANKLMCQIGDSITFNFLNNKYSFVVKSIESYQILNRSFIINMEFLEKYPLDIFTKSKTIIVLNKNKDFKNILNLISNEINYFTYDTTFERYYDLVNNLSYLFIIFSIVFAIFSFICCHIYINSILSYRRRDLQKFRIIGASIIDILKIYMPIYLIVILISLFASDLIAFFMLEEIRTLFKDLFDFNFICNNILFYRCGLGLCSVFIMILSTLLLIGSKNNYRKLR